jgi:hypothetical protein
LGWEREDEKADGFSGDCEALRATQLNFGVPRRAPVMLLKPRLPEGKASTQFNERSTLLFIDLPILAT